MVSSWESTARTTWILDSRYSHASIDRKHETASIINGLTTADGIALPNPQGGVLALQTNILGSPHIRDELGVSPELGAALKYQLTQRLELKVGYSFMYLSNVVRPGEQIDFNVDPLWIPSDPPAPGGRDNPDFAFNDSPFYIHGLTLGGEYRW